MKNDAVDPTPAPDLAELVAELRDEVRSLAARLAALEARAGQAAAATTPAPASVPANTVPAEPGEDDLLVIAAAVAAFLGVRARIRQVRLIQSTAWAQVGRATVHASHRVH